jgi:hypothetical protein
MTPLLLAPALLCLACVQASAAPGGDAAAVLALLDRVLPAGSSASFVLELSSAACAGPHGCFSVSGGAGAKVTVRATSVSELAFGVGHYLTQAANMTFGWPRGGGSRTVVPAGGWPAANLTRARLAPFSYATQVAQPTPQKERKRTKGRRECVCAKAVPDVSVFCLPIMLPTLKPSSSCSLVPLGTSGVHPLLLAGVV